MSQERVQSYRLRRDRERIAAIGTELGEVIVSMLDDLETAEPELPVDDRAADVWEPLVAIADAADPEWGAKARAACVELAEAQAAGAIDESLNVRLLADLREIVATQEADVPSAVVVDALRTFPESPWDRFGITQAHLARRLSEYGVRPRQIRPDGPTGKQVRGYRVADLTEVFARYLPPSQNVTMSHDQVEPPEDPPPVTPVTVTARESVTYATSACDTVTDGDTLTDEERESFRWIVQWNASLLPDTDLVRIITDARDHILVEEAAQ
jgi:hypothetical protein